MLKKSSFSHAEFRVGGGREGSVDSNDSLATHSKPDVWFNVGRRCVLCMFFCAWPGAGVRHACLRSLYVFSMLTYIFLLCVDLERPCVFLNLCTRVNVGSFRTHVHNKMKALSDLFGACVCPPLQCGCVRRRQILLCTSRKSEWSSDMTAFSGIVS